MSNKEHPEQDLVSLSTEMTAQEQASLLSGHRMWKTEPIDRLGIPNIVMTDGTYGVRYSIQQIENDEKGGQDFSAFLNVVNQRAKDVELAWGTMKPATCFPNGSSFGCSWDVDLAWRLGDALGQECQNMGVHLLLGPGINIRRTPLGGRSYEYYSEDPVVSGDIAAGVINGLQQRGVGASLKHFACNNSEVERTTMDSIVDERALREIYLRGFERAIKQSQPWTVMSSYNRLNGVHTAESRWLLTDVLRNDWGFTGVVVADWHGIKDRCASLLAGNDLDMPESESRKAELRVALEEGRIDRHVAEQSCRRILSLVQKAKAAERRDTAVDYGEHHQLARSMVAESIVLLKNDNQLLPLEKASCQRLLVIGEGATVPIIQGSGCATTVPTQVDIPLDEMNKLADGQMSVQWLQGTSEIAAERDALTQQACAAAAEADKIVIFVSTENGYDGEGSDRTTLALAEGHDALISAVAAVNPKVIVILANPDAVVMPWIDEVGAVVETFFSGQAMGGGLADVLFGNTNPSGKLTVSFPKRLQDTPSWLSYPGENGKHYYSEGIFVGYRWYDTRDIAPLFPFGFGLSYSDFTYSDLALDRQTLRQGETVAVSFTLTNNSARSGKEVCQLYSRYQQPRLARPYQELKGFCKVELAAGESRRITLTLSADDLRYYDTARGEWILDNDLVTLCVGTHSRDLPLQASLECHSAVARYRLIQHDTQPTFILENPMARSMFNQFLQREMNINEQDAERILEHCANSFVGIFTTFDRRLRHRFAPEACEQILKEINQAIKQQERDA